MDTLVSSKTNPANQTSDFKNEIGQAAMHSRDAFFTWFNQAEDADASFVRGQWDFDLHIANPLAAHLEQPEKLTCLEIGHGGGRLLNAAARHFFKAIGVDIHAQNDLVMKELHARGLQNVELHMANGASIPLPTSGLNVVYSFIVLQHVKKIAVFHDYLREAFRVLKPGGVAILYFGRKAHWSINKRNRFLFWLECIFENFWMPVGFSEIPAQVNHTNLLITRKYAKKFAQETGFHFLRFVVSFKDVPAGFGRYGGQHGILLRKPGNPTDRSFLGA